MSATTIAALNGVPTFGDKLLWSAIGAGLFILLSLPQTYGATTSATTTFGITTTTVDNCPTAAGKFGHAILFFIILYFIIKIMSNQRAASMGITPMSDGLIAKYAFYSTLLFFVIASPELYKLTGMTNEAGCPDLGGVVVHALIFLVVLLFMMYFPKDM